MDEAKEVIKWAMAFLVTSLVGFSAYMIKDAFDQIKSRLNSLDAELSDVKKENTESTVNLMDRIDSNKNELSKQINQVEKGITRLDATAQVSFESIKESVKELKQTKKEHYGNVKIID